jgi:acyl-CoA synthetase (AMP-forming)/AMP-acid ligase II
MLKTEIPAPTLVDILRTRSEEQSHKIVYRFLKNGEVETSSLTYQQLDLRVRAIAAYLQNQQLKDERVVMIYPYNQPLEFIVAFLGCLYAGVVAIPCHPPRNRRGWSEIQARLISADAQLILTHTKLLPQLNHQLNHITKLTTDQIPLTLATEWQKWAIAKENLAFLQYTSGSTGTPKGVMITHESLVYNQEMLKQAFGHSENSVGVGWLPLFHDMGLIGNLLQALYLGASCVFISPLDFVQKPIRWLQAISRYQATTSGAPNFAYDLLCRHVKETELEKLNLSSWELAFCGAEPIRLKTIETFASKFALCGFRKEAFYPCYGMAEATLLISGGDKNSSPVVRYVQKLALQENRVVISETEKLDFQPIIGCGHAWLDGKIAIVNPQSLKLCSANEIGEIWIASSGIGKGYWQQPEETANTFQGYISDTQDGPFLRTGDLGFIYQNELFITGRRHDTMVFWGFNHYPQQIEETVQKSYPGLTSNRGAAFAVEIEGQERLVIAQEVERGYYQSLDAEAAIEAILWAVFQEHFVDIHAIVLLKPGNIPQTSSGKIQHGHCRELYLTENWDIIHQWQRSPNSISDIITLLEKYLNPLTHLKRYLIITRAKLKRFFKI